jgi:hypothetical protein
MAKEENTSPKVVSHSPTRSHKLNIKPVNEEEYEVIRYDNPEIVEEVEKLYPETTMEFKRILFDQYELFCKKQLNYGPDNISVGTRLETPEEVKLSQTGLWFRMNDKIQRLKQLVLLGKEDMVGEAVEDTYQDLSIYNIIAQIVIRGKWSK